MPINKMFYVMSLYKNANKKYKLKKPKQQKTCTSDKNKQKTFNSYI